MSFNAFSDLPGIVVPGAPLDDDYHSYERPWVSTDDLPWNNQMDSARFLDYYTRKQPLNIHADHQLSNLDRYLARPDAYPFRADALHAAFRKEDFTGALTVQPPYEVQFSDMYPHRQSSPAEQSTTTSSWSASHSEDASTPHTARFSLSSNSEYSQSQLHYTDYNPMPTQPSHIAPSGGITLSAIQQYPDEHDIGPERYDDVDAEHDVHYEQDHVHPCPRIPLGNDDREDMELEVKPVGFGREDSDSDIKEEEDGADSDYKPRKSTASKRSPRRRSSQSSITSPGGIRKRQGGRRSSVNGVDTKGLKTKNGQHKREILKSKIATAETVTVRPFPCPFAGYHCNSTFTSKNEWKRHVSTQHIKLGFWRCDLCLPNHDASNPSGFNDFNRKDLFTQHLRRMHAGALASSSNMPITPTSPSAKKNGSGKAQTNTITEEVINSVQSRCYVRLRSPPPRSSCLFCTKTFSGSSSWADRMDHVGTHFERDRKVAAGNGTTENTMLDVDGWREDQVLRDWLVEEGLVAWDDVENGWRIGDGVPMRQPGQ